MKTSSRQRRLRPTTIPSWSPHRFTRPRMDTGRRAPTAMVRAPCAAHSPRWCFRLRQERNNQPATLNDTLKVSDTQLDRIGELLTLAVCPSYDIRRRQVTKALDESRPAVGKAPP